MSDLSVDYFFYRCLIFIGYYSLILLVTSLIVYQLPFVKRRKLQNKKDSLKHIMKQVFFTMVTATMVGIMASILRVLVLNDMTNVYLDIDQYPIWYFFASILIFCVVFEIYFDLLHRFMHTKFMYKRFHELHHETGTTSVFTIYHFHPVESFLIGSFYVLAFSTIPMHPYAILSCLFILDINNWFIHLGHEVFPKFVLKRLTWLNGATNHDQHHKNFIGHYGFFTNILDRVYGSFRKEYR